jgi:phosphatidylinositol glycan class B
MSRREALAAAELNPPDRSSYRSRLEAWLLTQEGRLLAFNLFVTLVTAWTSVTFFHPDEHYQTIEFVGLKLGFTPQHELPWEYRVQVRPWLQPALYYLLLKPLTSLGLSDRFLLSFVLRLCSGVLSFCSLLALVRSSTSWFESEEARRLRLRWLTLAGCVPYLAVRTSSENASASFFLLALALLIRDLHPEQPTATRLSATRALGGGVLLGLAFEARFQVAFMIVGLGLWLLSVGRIGLRSVLLVAAGLLATLVCALFVDRWGYGDWVFPPWSYARVNLLEGRAAEYGTKWFFAYLHITLANIFAPLIVLTIVGLTLCWMRRPRHVITWVTLPFVLGHSLIGHKEERFLFPVLLLGLVGAALGYEARPSAADARHVARAAAWLAARFHAFRGTRVYAALSVWNACGMLLLALYPLGWRPHLVFAQWVHDRVEGPAHFVADDPDVLPSYPFYRRAAWHLHDTQSVRSGAVFARTQGPVYFLRREPFTPLRPEERAAEMELVFSEFPGAGSSWVRARLFPWLGRLREAGIARGLQPKRATWISVYRLKRPQLPASAAAD